MSGLLGLLLPPEEFSPAGFWSDELPSDLSLGDEFAFDELSSALGSDGSFCGFAALSPVIGVEDRCELSLVGIGLPLLLRAALPRILLLEAGILIRPRIILRLLAFRSPLSAFVFLRLFARLAPSVLTVGRLVAVLVVAVTCLVIAAAGRLVAGLIWLAVCAFPTSRRVAA
ncbi:MAG: hypothetical protein U0992_06730 [Planctomycetaceae bacterium]